MSKSQDKLSLNEYVGLLPKNHQAVKELRMLRRHNKEFIELTDTLDNVIKAGVRLTFLAEGKDLGSYDLESYEMEIRDSKGNLFSEPTIASCIKGLLFQIDELEGHCL